MKRGMIYKLVFILALIALAVALILPTVGVKSLEITVDENITIEQRNFLLNRFKGRDYRLVEEGNVVTVSSRSITDAVMNEVRSFKGVAGAEIRPHWAENHLMAKKINLGLDLQGGMHLMLTADFDRIERARGEKLTEFERSERTQQALELLRNRVDKFGVSEPSIRPRGNETIEIQLPGVTEPEAVKAMIGTTGLVQYRLVDERYTGLAVEWLKKNYTEQKLPVNREQQFALLKRISDEIKLPSDFDLLFYFVRDTESDRIVPSEIMALNREVSLDGDDVSRAWYSRDEFGALQVNFQTTPEGAVKFSKVTDKPNHKKRLSVVIDDNIRSAPAINNQITGGQAVITGDFNEEEVKTLSRIINEGALPADLKFIEERTVGPTLGQDSIEAGVNAIIIGLSGVMLFMILFYKVAGLIACVGLVVNMTFLVALLSLMGFTLTLPGIAGLILTVGLAVDANVIIYERIKEELAAGKSVRMSIVYGYEKAFSTILDANLTTLIAAFVLSQFGTGPIKGFAVTLFVGILTSMFVALYVTRFVYELISLNKKMKKLSI